MARHSQKPANTHWICLTCRDYDCDNCVDVKLAIRRGDHWGRICSCTHTDSQESLDALEARFNEAERREAVDAVDIAAEVLRRGEQLA